MSAMSASGDVTVKPLTLEDLSMAAALLQRSAAKRPGSMRYLFNMKGLKGTFRSYEFPKSAEGSIFALTGLELIQRWQKLV